jgi:hypothetical protein
MPPNQNPLPGYNNPLAFSHSLEGRDPYAAAGVAYRRYLTPVPNREAAAYGSRLKAGTT